MWETTMKTFVDELPLSVDNMADAVARLEPYERVSLAFLLFEARTASNELSSHDMSISRSALASWALSCGPAWRSSFVEALIAIQAFRDVHDLGVDLTKAKIQFNTGDGATFVHPAKKALYRVCEDLKKSETAALINAIKKTAGAARVDIDDRDFTHLELFFVKLIIAEIVQIGSWNCDSNSPRKECKLDAIVDALRPFPDLQRSLCAVQSRINFQLKISYADSMNSSSQMTAPNINADPQDVYPIIDAKRMGYCIIFNQEKFSVEGENFTNRTGTQRDVERLTECWSGFGFKVERFDDLPGAEIPQLIDFHANLAEPEHSAYVVCVLSHGARGCVYGSDGVGVSEDALKRSMFGKSLVGKPKILIIQACRGTDRMGYEDVEADGVVHVAERADLLVFWSTVENYMSFRDRTTGSWFVQTLCDRLTDLGEKEYLMDIFVKVNGDISMKKVQVSTLESSWRKKFLLKKC